MKDLTLSKDEFKLIQEFLVEESGLYFAPDRGDRLASALSRRISQRECSSFTEYYDLLKSHPQGGRELKDLVELLTIGETYFFRNPAQFEVLKNSVLPEMIERKIYMDRNINIWSAGCSTGEEAYTLAILLLETLPGLAKWSVSIIATDINRDFLRRAQEGVYNQRSVSRVPEDLLKKYFTKQGSCYHLSDKVKQLVQLIPHNLAKDPFTFADMRQADIIFCRNVTIYFNFGTARQIIEKFYDVLNDNGYLFLGHSETLWQIPNKFRAIEFPHTFIYKKELAAIKEPARPFIDLPAFVVGDLSPVKLEKEADPQAVKELLAKALELANAGKYNLAIAELNKIIDLDNLYAEAYYLMGVLYEKTGKQDDAIREFRRAVYVDAGLAIACYNLGNIYSFQKKQTKAKREYQNAIRALEKKPADALVDFSDNLTNELLLIACKRSLEQIR
ncbi:MAG: CheR family methyltransferase [Candidatus Margulisiibacteriota bacterium]